MKKILILNGSHSDIPLILAAKELGFYVITSGNQPNLIGHRFANEYRQADYSNKEEVLSIAIDLSLDYICSCANDAGLITASFVAEQLNLPGFDPYKVSLLLHHKDQFKEYCETRDIPTPRALVVSSAKEALSVKNKIKLPLIIKPVDMTGGKGVTKVNDLAQYQQATDYAFKTSQCSKIVIEEFIEGPLHSFSTFIIKKKVHAMFSDNEFSTVNPYTVSHSSYPAKNFHMVKEQLIKVTEFIANDLNLSDGVLHHQYIQSAGKPYILEITRRCSGDLYPLPVKNALGVDWAKWIIKSVTNYGLEDFPPSCQNGFGGRFCIQADRNGIVKSYLIAEELRPFIVDEIVVVKPGESVINYLNQKLVVLILKYPDAMVMDMIVERISILAKVDIY